MRNGIPGEYERHHGTIAMYPSRTDIWRDNAIHMQRYVCDLVDVISRYERVYLFCYLEHQEYLKEKYSNNQNVIVVVSQYDDIWARDIGPTFAYFDGVLRCIDWKFNAWGGMKEGAYYPWDADDGFAREVSNLFGLKSIRQQIVLEGGALISDGNGTLFSTKSVVMNKNRNPFKKTDFVEKQILSATCEQRIIWLPQGLANDETNGHIDNILSVISSNELCLAWTDDRSNPSYASVRKAFDIVSRVHNLSGEKYKIHLIELPDIQLMSESEENGLLPSGDSLERKAGDILPASYLNFYMLNDAVIIPSFDCKKDKCVKQQFEKIFCNRDVIQVYSREPLLGGGGIHCILHEIPNGVNYEICD